VQKRKGHMGLPLKDQVTILCKLWLKEQCDRLHDVIVRKYYKGKNVKKSKSLKERDYFEDLDVDGRINEFWTGFIWVNTETSGRQL